MKVQSKPSDKQSQKIMCGSDANTQPRKTSEHSHRSRKAAGKAAVVLVTAITVGVLSIANANALTITNGDARVHRVVVVEKGKHRSIVLLPSEVATDLCTTTCELFLMGDPVPYEVIAGNAATINDGTLTFDDSSQVKGSSPDRLDGKP